MLYVNPTAHCKISCFANPETNQLITIYVRSAAGAETVSHTAPHLEFTGLALNLKA